MAEVKINAYRATKEAVQWKEPLTITARGASSDFCVLDVEGKLYVVKAEEVITAMEAACRG